MSSESIYIGTWFYSESKGEESNYPQVGGLSSSAQFQATYWRCIVVYFASSVKHNPSAKHILFTNLDQLPNIGTFRTGDFLNKLGVKVISLPLTYKTPPGYSSLWGSVFYIFDVLNYLSRTCQADDSCILLDSDCVWIDSVNPIVSDIKKHNVLSYVYDYSPEHTINGLSRLEMQKIYEELEHKVIDKLPLYSGGECFAANSQAIKILSQGIDPLWKELLERFSNNQLKFNEEGHTLSYLYYKFGYLSGMANPYIKRIWTSPQFYNASDEDFKLTIWHTPAEKKYGIKRLFSQVAKQDSLFWSLPTGEKFKSYLGEYLGIPKRSSRKAILDVFENRKTMIKNQLKLNTIP